MSSRKKSGLTHWLPSEADSEVELASRRVGRECSWNQQLGREWKKRERDWNPASPVTGEGVLALPQDRNQERRKNRFKKRRGLLKTRWREGTKGA